MAKNENLETRTSIDELNDTLTRAEMKVQDNKKFIMWLCIAVAAIVVIVLIYIYAILRPGKERSNTNYGLAALKETVYNIEQQQGLDSASSAQRLAEVAKAYETVAESEGHDGGNNATLMAAVYEYKLGNYEKALEYLDDYDKQDNIIAATSRSLAGDCYVNLDKFDEAISAYRDACSLSDNNPVLIPMFKVKEATVQRHLKNYAAEAELYQEIIDNYPESTMNLGIDVETYLARAKANAGAAK